MAANCVKRYSTVHTYWPSIIKKNTEFYIVKHATRHLITQQVLWDTSISTVNYDSSATVGQHSRLLVNSKPTPWYTAGTPHTTVSTPNVGDHTRTRVTWKDTHWNTQLSHTNARTVIIRMLTGETWNPIDLFIRTLRATYVLSVVRASNTTHSWKGTKLNVQASSAVTLRIIEIITIVHRIR